MGAGNEEWRAGWARGCFPWTQGPDRWAVKEAQAREMWARFLALPVGPYFPHL